MLVPSEQRKTDVYVSSFTPDSLLAQTPANTHLASFTAVSTFKMKATVMAESCDFSIFSRLSLLCGSLQTCVLFTHFFVNSLFID